MKPEQQYIEYIRNAFTTIQTKEDLLSVINDAKKILYGVDCKPFQLKSLTYYANPDFCPKKYTQFVIKKKSGGDRIINAPVIGLKAILRVLNFVLQCISEPHRAATGFMLNKSIVDNAQMHAGRQYVYNLDLKDFFHSFDRKRVKYGFVNEPFNLSGEREQLAFLIACLCTHPFEIDGEVKIVLPQGSPTSPTITNILCVKLDKRLTGLAKRFGLKYSRYADDITFSSQKDMFKDEKFQKELLRLIREDQELTINPAKTRLQHSSQQQEVTGLIVNEKVNVRQRYLKQIRMWLYYWEKYGYAKAQSIFIKDYKDEKGHVKKGQPEMVNVLDGKLEFLKMVKGVEDSTFLRLKRRYDKLIFQNKQMPVQELEIEHNDYNKDLDYILSRLTDSNFDLKLL